MPFQQYRQQRFTYAVHHPVVLSSSSSILFSLRWALKNQRVGFWRGRGWLSALSSASISDFSRGALELSDLNCQRNSLIRPTQNGKTKCLIITTTTEHILNLQSFPSYKLQFILNYVTQKAYTCRYRQRQPSKAQTNLQLYMITKNLNFKSSNYNWLTNNGEITEYSIKIKGEK